MTGDQAAGLIWGFGSLVLVGTALAARRVPAQRLGRMALIWTAIFATAVSLAILWGMVRDQPGRDRSPAHSALSGTV